MNSKPFSPTDALEVDSVMPVFGIGGEDSFLAVMARICAEGPCATLYDEKGVIMCGGIRNLWNGVGESWMLFSKTRNGPSVLKYARNWLDSTIAEYGYHRVQAVISIGSRWSRTARFFGFQFEASLKSFGPGREDMALYSRIV